MAHYYEIRKEAQEELERTLTSLRSTTITNLTYLIGREYGVGRKFVEEYLKLLENQQKIILKLDSGDVVWIQEKQKNKRKQTKK